MIIGVAAIMLTGFLIQKDSSIGVKLFKGLFPQDWHAARPRAEDENHSYLND